MMNSHSLQFSSSYPTFVTSTSTSTSSSFRCRGAVATPQPKHAARRKLSSGSLYQVLRVKPNATVVDIKNAYRNLAKVYHPDATQSDNGCHFMEIRNAYETLSDPAARAVYDLSIGFGFGSSFQGHYSSGRFQTSRRWETDQCW